MRDRESLERALSELGDAAVEALHAGLRIITATVDHRGPTLFVQDAELLYTLPDCALDHLASSATAAWWSARYHGARIVWSTPDPAPRRAAA